MIYKANIKTYNKKNYSTKMGAIHHWIKRRKQKPDKCEECGKSKPLELINISQKYLRDINDYQWLCRRCHQKIDGRMTAFKNGIRDRLGRFNIETFKLYGLGNHG